LPELPGQAVDPCLCLGRLNKGLDLRPLGNLADDLRSYGFGKLAKTPSAYKERLSHLCELSHVTVEVLPLPA
jgi:hypothetical protein